MPCGAAGPAAESADVREYAKFRVRNNVEIGHELGASFAAYWPGSLGYYVQGAVEETNTLRWYAEVLNAACEHDIEIARRKGRSTLQHCLEAKPFEPRLRSCCLSATPCSRSFRPGSYASGDGGPESRVSAELMWGGAPRTALARTLLAGKLFHFDINDGYRLIHDVDIGIGLVNPLDWLNILILLRSHNYTGPVNLDYKPPRTTSQFGVFEVSFPSAVDRFITLWEMAGETIADPIIQEATAALNAGAVYSGDPMDVQRDAQAIAAANRELLTLHKLIAHRLVLILLGAHRGRVFTG